jgi:hypothetical protein
MLKRSKKEQIITSPLCTFSVLFVLSCHINKIFFRIKMNPEFPLHYDTEQTCAFVLIITRIEEHANFS